MAYRDTIRREAAHHISFDSGITGIVDYAAIPGASSSSSVFRNYGAANGPPLTGRGQSLDVTGVRSGGGNPQIYSDTADTPPAITQTTWALECVVYARSFAARQGLIWRVNEGVGGYWMRCLNGIMQGGARSAGGGYLFAQATGALALRTRYHLLFTCTPTQMVLYANAFPIASTAIAADPPAPAATQVLRLGSENAASTGFDGLIDDVAIYDGFLPDPTDHVRLLPRGKNARLLSATDLASRSLGA